MREFHREEDTVVEEDLVIGKGKVQKQRAIDNILSPSILAIFLADSKRTARAVEFEKRLSRRIDSLNLWFPELVADPSSVGRREQEGRGRESQGSSGEDSR
jgi:hypothetical protein